VVHPHIWHQKDK